MIDPFGETLLSLSEAARLIPRRRAGKKCNIATIYRWTADGCKGVKLESVQVGGSRCTSREAIARFFDALTSKAGVCPTIPTRTQSQRDRASERAAKALAAAGI
jgi:hypothetical protein